MKPAKTKLSIGSKTWDKTFQMMSWWKSEDVRKARVMVVGAGALGNEVLKNLTLLNIGQILIVDFDSIEYSNLSRSILYREDDCGQQKADVAAKRVREINPNVKVMTIQGDIGIDVGLGVFRRMDAVIGCLDNRLARLFLNRACHKVNKTWVDGAIENLAGQLQVYKPGTSCYECGLSPAEWANIRFRMGCPDVARRNAMAGKIPTTPISASLIAALQTQEALKVVLKNDKQSMAGQKFYFEGMNNHMMQYEGPPLKEDCLSHFTYDPIQAAPTLSHTLSLSKALEILSKEFGMKAPQIELDHEVVTELYVEDTEKKIPVKIAKPHLKDEFLKGHGIDPSGETFISQDVKRLDASFSDQDATLKELGIPALHILQVTDQGKTHFIELTGDEGYLAFT